MNNSGGGIGFAGALFLIFLILKLVGAITWPWLWVFAPLWIPAGLVLAYLIILGIVFIFAEAIPHWKARK